MTQATQAQCGVISGAYVEIFTADNQSEDRYCGTFLAQSADGTNPAKSAGIIYGKFEEHFSANVVFIRVNKYIYIRLVIAKFEIFLFILASESNPWNMGVYALSGLSLDKVGGFSITAQQTPCGLDSTSQNKDSVA